MAAEHASSRLAVLLLASSLLLVSCTQPGPSGASGSGPVAPAAPKSLTIALEDEPLNLATLLEGGSSSAGEIRHVVHQRLAAYNDRGEAGPQLATELPSQERGTWTVRPDGTMQTTYRIHRTVTWHDGTPLTAKDFVFAYNVTLDPEIPVSQQQVARQVARIETPDDYTLVIEWKNLFPLANAIIEDDLGPFPEHLLGGMYQTNKDQLARSAYWTREFVGVGPYRLVEWEPGNYLVLKAYDNFFTGRAKIDTLTFRFINNPSTAVANLLAGTVDGVAPRALEFAGAVAAKEEWEKAGKTAVFVAQSANWARLGVQFRVPNPIEVTDARVRRGLYHAIDRQALTEALSGGLAPLSETFVAPDDAKWDWVKDSVVKYDYSPARAREVLVDAGWRSGSDGSLVNASGEKLSVGLWASGADRAREIAIIADYWKAVGVNVDQYVLSPAQNRDDQFRVSYPAFSITTFPATFEFTVRLLNSGGCPSDATRWRGNNRGCYQDRENDRLIDALSTAIAIPDQQRLYRELVRYRGEQLPELPLYFAANLTVFREGVTGIKGIAKPRGGLGWNVTEWDVR